MASPLITQLFRRKSVALAAEDAERPGGLARSLTAIDITMLGIGAIIGAGIFSGLGEAAAGKFEAGQLVRAGAGPALVVSYLITAVACAFSAMCYAELASMLPIAGSAYTYAYVTLGELLAWIIGWDLLLEYAVGNTVVAISWSSYFVDFVERIGIHLPLRWVHGAFDCFHPQTGKALSCGDAGAIHGIANLPAFAIVALLTILLVVGVKESARFNTVMVALKLLLIAGFVAAGIFYVKPEHWHPFAPNGFVGIMNGASLAFFSYIGFDAVSTTAEEAKNPQRDLPIGMIASLAICTVLYVAVTLVMTGLTSYKNFANVSDPLAVALGDAGLNSLAGIMSFGVVIAMTAVLLVFQLGQPRIFLSMARDGLLPPFAAKLHPRFHTPHVTTILTGVFVGGVALFADMGEMLQFTNIGTLFAFILVSAGVIMLRYTEPDRPRPFRCPGMPYVPILSILCCLGLMLPLPATTWWRFAIWLAIGAVFYFFYGYKHSRLRRGAAQT